MGMVSRPWKIACALNHEYSVTIICSKFSHTRTCNPMLSRTVSSSVEFCFLSTIVPLSIYAKLPRILQSILFNISLFRFCLFDSGKPDLLINSIPSHFQVFPARLLNVLYPRLIIITDIRDLWSYSVNHYHGGGVVQRLFCLIASRFFYFCEKSAINASTLVTSVFETKIISEYYQVPPDCFFLLRNGFGSDLAVNRQTLSKVPSCLDLPSNRGCSGNPLSFVYAGSLSSSIAFETFLNIFVDLCDSGVIFARLYIASPTPLVLSPLQSEFVSWLGPLGQSELVDLLSKSDVAVAKTNDSPVFLKGVSLTKYSDYMLSSLPILDLVNCDSTPVTQAQCGVHALPTSRESISQALLKINSISRNDLLDLGVKGRSWALSNLDMELSVKMLLKRLP